MFSRAFGNTFAGRGGGSGFGGGFAGAFAGRGGDRYIGPLMAKAELASGAAWAMHKNGLVINGAVLIGPAGKIYQFASASSAARWVAAAKNVAKAEISVGRRVSQRVADGYKEKKRGNLSVIAGCVALAAARQVEPAKRAALLAESEFCIGKWG